MFLVWVALLVVLVLSSLLGVKQVEPLETSEVPRDEYLIAIPNISTAELCVAECDQRETCIGSVFEPGSCLIRSPDPGTTDQGKVKFQMYGSPRGQTNLKYGTPKTLLQECSAQCDSMNEGCLGAIFAKDMSCILFTPVKQDGGKQFSFYKKPLPAHTDRYEKKPEVKYALGSIGAPLENTTVEACQSACNTAPGCKGFLFTRGDNSCTLKSAFGKEEAFLGIDAYIRNPEAVTATSSANPTSFFYHELLEPSTV